MSPKAGRPLEAFLVGLVVLFVSVSTPIRADEVQLRPDHPERYVVVKGDTLWDISARFLKSPWHWPQIWKINQEIKNPHLIYPGDVVVLRLVDGKPVLTVERRGQPSELPSLPVTEAPVVERRLDDRTVKLSPTVHSEPLAAAIPTIPPNAIVPFLTRPLAVEEHTLEQAGYITTGMDDHIALGDNSQFYARGIKDDGAEYFQIFRPGKAIRNPDTGELLAYEAQYLGDAKRLESGDPSKLVVTSVKQEIQPTDRLLVAPKKASLPYYYPHAPKQRVTGRIVSALNAVAEIGPKTVVGISLGKRDGVDEGSVLRVMRHVGQRRDPVTREYYQLPDEESALVMIFRTYDKISYGLIMSATRPVHLLDTVVTP